MFFQLILQHILVNYWIYPWQCKEVLQLTSWKATATIKVRFCGKTLQYN